jgi:hypothetical protein
VLPRILSFVLPLPIYAALVLTAWGIYRARRRLDWYAVALAIGVFLISLAVRPNQHLLFFDEDIYIQIASNLSHAPVAQLTLLGSPKDIQVSTYYKEPAGFPVLLSLIFIVTGTHEVVAFVVARMLYAIAVAAVYLLARTLITSRLQALTAAVAFAATPACFAFSSSAGTDLPAALFACLGVWGIVSGNEMLAAGALAMAAQTRLEMIILAPLVLFARKISTKWKIWFGVLLIPQVVHITWVFSIAPKLAAAERVSSAFSAGYLFKNLRDNLEYIFNPLLFPVAVAILSIVAAVSDRRFYTRSDNGASSRDTLKPAVIDRRYSEERLPIAAWFLFLFVVYCLFYAGSFNINPRYSIQLTIPLILLATSLTANRAVLAAIALSAILPALRPWQLPTYVQALASDHKTAVEFVAKVDPKDLVISGEPEIFLNHGRNAMNAVFASEHIDRVQDAMGRFGRVYYYGGIRTDEPGTEQWEADRKVKSAFELHLIEAQQFAGLRIAVYQLLQLIHREGGQAVGLIFDR